MTNRKAPQIKIVTRRGKIHPSVKHGSLYTDGIVALILIAIIVAARFARVIIRLMWRILVWLTPVVVRLVIWLAREVRALYYMH